MHDRVLLAATRRDDDGVDARFHRALVAALLDAADLGAGGGELLARLSVLDPGLTLIGVDLAPRADESTAWVTRLRDGSFDTHLKTLRAEHARRCTQMLAAILEAMDWLGVGPDAFDE